jgi:hypothetical protein
VSHTCLPCVRAGVCEVAVYLPVCWVGV